MYRLVALALLLCVGCFRAPARIDVAALLAKHGPVEAHRQLAERILADPRDVQARLALAALDDKLGRPGEELDQLDFVYKLSGPLGVRWHDEDRERYAKLLVARGTLRTGRRAASALEDLERARDLGATVSDSQLASARVGFAMTLLRHVDAGERARGREILQHGGERPWLVQYRDVDDASAFALWAWSIGARREAYEQLSRLHQKSPKPPAEVEAAYERAAAWWSAQGAPNLEPEPAAAKVASVEGDPRVVAAVHYARATVSTGETLRVDEVARAFARDPAIAERLGRDLVAKAVDSAAAHAVMGALFYALGDPARSRVEWQAAVDSSPERAFVRGLAEAAAAGGDGAAAAVFATRAAAAWGDPAVVWVSVARVLEDRGLHVDALAAARSALELAGPDTRAGALDVAIEASRALGRDAQTHAMAIQRGAIANEPPDVHDALVEYERHPGASAVARLWVVSRTHPRDIASRAIVMRATAADDPRHAGVTAELVALAGDADTELARASLRALAHG